MLQRFEGVGAGSSGAVEGLAIFSAVSMAETTSLLNAHVRDPGLEQSHSEFECSKSRTLKTVKTLFRLTLIARPLPATHLSTTREVALPLGSAASPPRGCHATLTVTSLHTVR